MLIKTMIFRVTLSFILILISASAMAEIEGDDSVVSGSESTYLVGAGDMLKVSVWKEPDLTLEVLVAPDGSITFPLAGDIKASGLTTKQLSDVLVEKLKRYIPHPNVTVRVTRSVSNAVYIIGKVVRPGRFAASGYMDVLQALTLAGGLTPYADSDEIKILRRTDTGNEVMEFDYDEVVSGERLDMNIILKAGDTVVVP